MNIWVLIYRFAWTTLAVLLLLALVAAFYPRVSQYHDLQQQQAKMEEDIRMEEELLKHLKMKQDRLLNDPRFVEKIAREELGLTKPGETVFKFTDDEPSGTTRATNR
ncbi:MAG: septum formation initiator family protein [bacterium]